MTAVIIDNSSDVTLNFLKYLPNRLGITPLSRGLEIGMAHGYWLIGPFATLGSIGSLRDANVGNLVGLLACRRFDSHFDNWFLDLRQYHL